MATQTDKDGNPIVGTEDKSNLTDSGNQGNAAASAAVTIPKAEWDNLIATVKGLQSDKDRGVTRLEKRFDGFEGEMRPLLERAAQYMKDGDSVDTALSKANTEQVTAASQAAIIELANAYKSGKLFSNAGTDDSSAQNAIVTKAIDEFGLDPQDPDVAALDLKGKKPEEVERAVERLALRKALSPKPNQAQSAAGQGEKGAETSNEDQKIARMNELQQHPVENRKAIQELKKELNW